MTEPHSIKLLGWDDLRDRGIKDSKPTIYRKIKAGTFPPPVEPTPGTRGWFESAIVRWHAELRAKAGLPANDDPPTPA